MRTRQTAVPEKARRDVKSIGRAFAKDIDSAFIGAATVSYADIARRFRSLEHYYVPRLKGHPSYALEIRRRIAENLLEQALVHGCTLSFCRTKLKAASRLGYSNVERKAHFHLIYARGALACGHNRVAKRIVAAMVAELGRSLKKRKSPLAEQLLEVTKQLLNFIDKGSFEPRSRRKQLK
jgi:hypothetical protein